MTTNIYSLNSISKLKRLKFQGQDVSLDISLGEYGLAWKGNGKDCLFIYSIGNGRFDRITFLDYKKIQIEKEYDWADLQAVADSVGLTLKDWTDDSFVNKIVDLISYYGTGEIFGTSYWEGFEIKGLTKE